MSRQLISSTVALSVARFRRGGWAGLAWAARLTSASVAAYALALVFFPGTEPLLAPLTALLVIQLTPVSLLASGVDRVVSVAVGVSVAAIFSTAVDLTLWSLAVVIAVSLVVGQVLRLGSNLIEVPISAMLVLGVGSLAAESAAWQRVAETLVGAGVGVASNLLVPPRVRTRDAAAAIDAMFDDLAGLLDRAAAELASSSTGSPVLPDRAAGWLDDVRRLTHDIPNVGSTLLRAEESRRLNLRAVGTPDPGPGLRHGMEALEHSAVTVRSLFRSLLDAGTGGGWAEGEHVVEVEGAIAVLLGEFADVLRAFGRLVRAEIEPGHGRAPDLTGLREALEGLSEARARIDELILTESAPMHSELNFALLVTVKRLARELDLDEHVRRQAGPRSSPLARMRQRGQQ
jgi:hypothetical protein